MNDGMKSDCDLDHYFKVSVEGLHFNDDVFLLGIDVSRTLIA